MLTLGPGALGMTGLESRYPFALDQGVELPAGSFTGWWDSWDSEGVHLLRQVSIWMGVYALFEAH